MRRLLAVAALALTVTATAGAALTAPPNDQYLARQWYLGRDHALDTFDAAKQLFTVRVAVIDSGVDLGHPELKNRVVAHRSFVGGTVADTLGHGTFVAGEIAAIADNTTGIAGLAPPARLVVAKVVRDDGTIPPRAEARAIRWAVQQGARVVNLSLGSTRDPSDPSVDGFSRVEQRAIEFAVRHGALVVAAVGNGNDAPQKPWPWASYPAAFPHVLGVGAYGRSGGVPSFSNRDDRYVDLTAPGMDIFSLFPRPLTAPLSACLEQGYSSCGGKDYKHADGTSFSSPQVAAAAALLFGEEPALRPDQVSALLKLSADDATPANGCDDCSPGPDSLSGFGRLDVGAALDALQSPAPDADRFEPNDDAGRDAAIVYRSMSATRDARLVGRPERRLPDPPRARPAAVGARHRGPEGRPVDRALEAGPPRARRRALRPAREALDPSRRRARADPLQGAPHGLVHAAGAAGAAGPASGPYRIHLAF